MLSNVSYNKGKVVFLFRDATAYELVFYFQYGLDISLDTFILNLGGRLPLIGTWSENNKISFELSSFNLPQSAADYSFNILHGSTNWFKGSMHVVGYVFIIQISKTSDEVEINNAIGEETAAGAPGSGDMTAFLSVYRTILDSSGSHTAAKAAGTYGMGQGDPLAISGTGTLYPLNTIYIDSNDYPTIDGKTPKLRIRAIIECNDVAPFTGTFTIGLHPVTRPGTSGGAGLDIYTIGSAMSGSTVVGTNLAADSQNNLVGADFALPANGFYVLAVVTSAAMATSSHVHISAALQQHNT